MRLILTAAVLAAGLAAARAQDEKVLKSFEERYQAAAEKAQSAVVSILVERDAAKEPKPPLGTPMQTGGPFAVRPIGAPVSGVILGDDGYIATSYFNVKGDIGEVKVTLPSGEVHKADVVGFHAAADVALLKIDAKGLPTLRATDLTQVRTGMPVVALGRAPDGKGLTMNPGILSAPGRLDNRAVQIDSKLNYGNVGGPLVDLEGRLVGVTCKVDTRSAPTFGQNSGVSFAIVLDKLNELLPELKKGLKKISGTGRPFLGITPVLDPPADSPGVPLETIQPGSAAELGGLRPGDVVLEFDGVKTPNFNDLRNVILKKAIGDRCTVKFLRDGKEETITVILGERPGD